MADKPNITIGHLRITDHLILGMTKAKIDQGVETFQHCSITPKAMVGWNEIGESLQNGEIDMAFILAPYAMELFHANVKINLVLLGHRDGSIIVTNKKANINSIEDFKGKTILIPYHLSIHHMIINQILTQNGLTTGLDSDVIFEVVAPSQIPEFLEYDEDGSIGGYIVAEPWGTQVVKKGMGQEWKLSKEIWPNHPCCVVVASEKLIAQNPEAVAEIVDSFVKSGKLIHAKKDSAIKVASSFLKQEEEVVRHVLTNPQDRVTYDKLLPDIDNLEKMQNYLTNEISALSAKVDLEKFIDFQFAKACGAD